MDCREGLNGFLDDTFRTLSLSHYTRPRACASRLVCSAPPTDHTLNPNPNPTLDPAGGVLTGLGGASRDAAQPRLPRGRHRARAPPPACHPKKQRRRRLPATGEIVPPPVTEDTGASG